jgi:hypothetical protein
MSKIHVDGCDVHLTFLLTSPKVCVNKTGRYWGKSAILVDMKPGGTHIYRYRELYFGVKQPGREAEDTSNKYRDQNVWS